MLGIKRSHTYTTWLNKGSFRLLRVEPQLTILNDAPTVFCRLSTHDVARCPSYIALSYAWQEPLASQDGNELDSKAVMLDDEAMTVTPNLYHALRHIAARQPTSQATYYWIDALCIDQNNNSERTAQVAIMHRIYENAEKVVVWLGPDPQSEAYLVREFFRMLLQRYYDEDDKSNDDGTRRHYEVDFLNQDGENDLLKAELPQLDAEIWKAVVRFWDRRWFSRTWVSQEVALAKSAELWCGEVEFTQVEIVEVSRLFIFSGLHATLLPVRSNRVNIPKSTQGRPVGASAVRIHDLQLWARGEVYELPDDFCAATQRIVGQAHPDEGGYVADFLLRVYASLLHLHYRDDATDPRDKIFSLLVLLKRIAEAYNFAIIPLTTDYSRRVEDVFRETTAWMIEESGWLGILCLLQPSRRLDTLKQWPSWVPDYNSSLPSGSLLMFEPFMELRIQLHTALITLETRPKVSGRYLTLSVKRIGVVADIGDTYTSMIDEGCFELTARLLLKHPIVVNGQGKTRIDMWIETLAGHSSAQPVDAEGRANFKQYLCFFILRRMKADFNDGVIRAGREHLAKMPSFELLANADASETLPNYAYWSSRMSTPEKTSKLFAEILDHRPRFETMDLRGRRLIRLTQLGYSHCPPAQLLAVGPEDTQAGDEIYLVAGTAMPLVLRPRNRSNASSPGVSHNLQACIVGEASVWSFDDVVERLESKAWQKGQIE